MTSFDLNLVVLIYFTVRQLLGFEGEFKCVLADDGCEVVPEVLEAIIDSNEKTDLIMILKNGEQWNTGGKYSIHNNNVTQLFSLCLFW
jgi:hypothetical protein